MKSLQFFFSRCVCKVRVKKNMIADKISIIKKPNSLHQDNRKDDLKASHTSVRPHFTSSKVQNLKFSSENRDSGSSAAEEVLRKLFPWGLFHRLLHHSTWGVSVAWLLLETGSDLSVMHVMLIL